MKPKPVSVRLLKTHYPHWGKRTAFNAFLDYFNNQAFNLTMRDVPMNSSLFLSTLFSRSVSKIRPGNKIRGYGWNDFWAECRTFNHAVFGKMDVLHLIDAEHSLLFLPGWFQKFRFLKNFPKIIAMFHQPPAILEKIIDIEIACQASHVLTVAPDQADFFAGFMPVERLSTILLGVDTDYFKPRDAEKKPGTFRCLSGGIWLRDYQAVLKTAELLAGIPEIEFHIVSSAVTIPAHSKNIYLHRGISDSVLLELYQNSQVLFLPLKDATANTFLLEGCACGLPVVSSALPSLKVYFPGEEAILVGGNDPHVFAGALSDLYHDSDKHARMSQCARQRALQLSWEKIVPEYERLYRKLAGF